MKKATPVSVRISLFALLITVLMLGVQVVFAGGVDPEIVYDSRICGLPGTTTAANTGRWTNIFSNGDPATDTGLAFEPNTAVTILGRDFWGCWVSVTSATHNGWVPINSLNTRGVMGMPILYDNSMGCEIVGSQVVCPFDSGATTAPTEQLPSIPAKNYDTTASRWTNIYDINGEVIPGTAVPMGGTVTVSSTAGGWTLISSIYGSGRVPSNALNPQ